MRRLSKPSVWILILIAVVAISFLTFVMAPAKNIQNRGSSYNRGPDGYGAWYAFMEQRGTVIKRWQKPFEELIKDVKNDKKVTLVQVNSVLKPNISQENHFLYGDEQEWIKKGNHLVILGLDVPVTEAPFQTTHIHETGTLEIETRRRGENISNPILKDQYGAIIWQKTLGTGKVTLIVTSYWAANAYQNSQGNYELLAKLVTENNTEILIDEYIHGYKNTEIITEEHQQGLLSYFAKTPILPMAIQGMILMLIVIWGGNQRFGQRVPVSVPKVNNNTAYIQALAGVLQKAESREFLIDILGKEERLQLQKNLGLGPDILTDQALIEAWLQQTSQSQKELESLLKFESKNDLVNDKTLLMWLYQWKQIRNYFTSSIQKKANSDQP